MPLLDLPLNLRVRAWANPHGFAGVDYLTYALGDGREDWALAWPGARDTWVVALHGHGAHGDQLFTRPDLRDAWLATYRALGCGVLAPNLRDNAWMCPAAVAELHRLLTWARDHYGVRQWLFISGSMGGTANLIYGVRHPEDVAAMVALCPATDLARYLDWLAPFADGIQREIADAITAAYGGTPAEQPARYAAHAALRHADRLTMPLYVAHGDDDRIIPVEESRRLAVALARAPHFTYAELPGGHHDAPLFALDLARWIPEHWGA